MGTAASFMELDEDQEYDFIIEGTRSQHPAMDRPEDQNNLTLPANDVNVDQVKWDDESFEYRLFDGEISPATEIVEVDFAEDSLDLDTKHQGRGGIIHRYWQHRIKEAFEEQGWAAELEVFDADVYANTGETEIVVEVAMGDNQREINHVNQHLETGFDEVWVACRNREILEGLKQRIKEQGLDRDGVAFRLVRKFRENEE
jgi:hypothetical protein